MLTLPSPGGGNDLLSCVANCSTSGGYVSVPITPFCTDYSIPLQLTIGQRSDIVNISAGSHFTVAFRDHAWQPLALYSSNSGMDWSIACSIDLSIRPDGKLNTPPVATMISPINIPAGITQYIPIPILDADNDYLKCRYSTKTPVDECGDVCQPSSLPNGTTIFPNCTLAITGVKSNDWYAVAIQVEDFWNSTTTTAFSSVPIQFLIHVYTSPSCTVRPPLIGAVLSNACIGIQVGQPFTMELVAENNCGTNTSITDIGTSNKVQSEQYCVTFFVGTSSVGLCPGETTTTTTANSTDAVITALASESNSTNLGLIIGLSVALPLALLCCWCCLLRYLSCFKRRRKERKDDKQCKKYLTPKLTRTDTLKSSSSIARTLTTLRDSSDFVEKIGKPFMDHDNVKSSSENDVSARSSKDTLESSTVGTGISVIKVKRVDRPTVGENAKVENSNTDLSQIDILPPLIFEEKERSTIRSRTVGSVSVLKLKRSSTNLPMPCFQTTMKKSANISKRKNEQCADNANRTKLTVTKIKRLSASDPVLDTSDRTVKRESRNTVIHVPRFERGLEKMVKAKEELVAEQPIRSRSISVSGVTVTKVSHPYPSSSATNTIKQ
ncbi:unnamed protein product [Didymodactylos carnosus]|uniref:Uncharacterized protein n=1 Tax=Didymodactylos carnosus TaxID=1234261 RepID=A0A814ABS4_9BILA|nr:unnamed protein product [Didymodactylos carnosus]CAF1157833.1 unnamed protein product [Didymodactylos carnosus]CAF3693468.1 unnamed protein product [Didymodactylos carnosus]CAF3969328.1 unnamed protein product [Didymodactylos carnosus]